MPFPVFPASAGIVNETVEIEAPARLHLGFIDLHGGLGRRFGGLGVALAELGVALSCRRAPDFSAAGPDAGEALQYVRRLLSAYDFPDAVRIEVRRAIPRHAGLGSGTQLALAAGTAAARLFGLSLEPRELALRLGRGARSGIGLGAFAHGGFLVDGGRSADGPPPPIIARHVFPAHWRIILLLVPSDAEGLSGRAEREAFRSLPEFPAAVAARLARTAMLQVLPALVEADLPAFARGVGELQRAVGGHFAPAQGGRFAHPAVRRALAHAEGRGFAGVGQSSWGPTGFVLTDSETQAHALARDLQRRAPELDIRVASAAGSGHRLRTVAAAAPAAEPARRRAS